MSQESDSFTPYFFLRIPQHQDRNAQKQNGRDDHAGQDGNDAGELRQDGVAGIMQHLSVVVFDAGGDGVEIDAEGLVGPFLVDPGQAAVTGDIGINNGGELTGDVHRRSSPPLQICAVPYSGMARISCNLNGFGMIIHWVVLIRARSFSGFTKARRGPAGIDNVPACPYFPRLG